MYLCSNKLGLFLFVSKELVSQFFTKKLPNFRLLSHESNQHSIEHAPCKHCTSKGFSTKRDLIMHETHEHNTKIFSCSVCGVRVESIRTARSHFREIHSEKPLYCHLCRNTFASMIQVIIFNFTKKNSSTKETVGIFP